MPFPDVDRVIYRKNPLQRVICQLRFPPILKIEAEIPASFQDAVRTVFPEYSERAELEISVPQQLEASIPAPILERLSQAPRTKNYEFKSEDGSWKLNLARSFLALTSYRYERWEQFHEVLSGPIEALQDIYSPAYYSRIGLRYINVIDRDKLDLANEEWTALLKPHVLGILSSPEVGRSVLNFQSIYEMRLADGHSLARMEMGFIENAQGNSSNYKIDSDFYTAQRTALGDVESTLDFLRLRGSRLFRWAITDRLNQAMEPEII